MESSVDEARARIIDLVARVPVEDSVKQVSDAMWQDLNSLSQMPDKSYRYMNERGPDAGAQSFDLTIRCPSANQTIISKTTSQQCEVKFYFQLFVERLEGLAATEKDIKFIQEDVLEMWGIKLRSHWQGSGSKSW
ncbi:hypothetical protein PC111_g16430 [Phytophthora cactorum]|nr:hypothetical protein PC111_g16430 [Phytophthora cactorum]KAG3067550.1 hypothetical protein PC122_g17329 [Phytophthora cactorum]KAG3141351.1 hypothetical protein C6341_g19796 [Phytophthora cactorum]